VGNKGGQSANDAKKPESSGGQGEVIPQQIISRSQAKIEVSLAKAIYERNQILGSLINSVRQGENDFSEWEKKFEDAVMGKSQMDLVSESIIDDTYNKLLSLLENSVWLDTVSKDFTKQIVDEYNTFTEKSLRSVMEKQAELDFIEGKSEFIDVGDVQFERKSVTHDLVLLGKKFILESLLPQIILVAEKEIVNYKFNLDVTDITDNNNVKIARSISESVTKRLPQILLEVVEKIRKELGE